MRVTISRYQATRKAGFLHRRKLVYVLAIRLVFSDEEMGAIKSRNLFDLPVMDRPFHPLWRKNEEEWKEIQALPVGLLVHLHETQRMMEVGYYANDFDAESGERQLRRGLETLKAIITGSRETDRVDEFEL